jgi:hypothetical protein
MATSDGFLQDQLRDLEDVSARRMFGGVGIYSSECFKRKSGEVGQTRTRARKNRRKFLR